MSTFEERVEIRERFHTDGWFLFFRAVERVSGRELVVCRPTPELVISSSQVIERFHGRLAILRAAEFVVTEAIVDGDVDTEGPVFASPRFEGLLLSEREGPFSQGEFKQLAERLCEGLVEIHRKGVAHGCLASELVRLRVDPEGMSVSLGGVMRTVFAGVVEDPSGRSMRECDLVQLGVILAEVLGIDHNKVGDLAATDPNAAFLQLLLHSGFRGGLADAEQALRAAQELPSKALAVVTPPPPPPAHPQIAVKSSAPATPHPGAVVLATGPGVSQQAPPVQELNVVGGEVKLASPSGVANTGVKVPKKSNTAKYVLGALALTLLVVMLLFVVNQVASQRAQAKRGKLLVEVSERFEQTDPGNRFLVSEEELDVLLGSLKATSAKSDHSAPLRILQVAYCEDSSRDGAQIREAALSGDYPDQMRAQLFSLLKVRGIYVEVPQILDWVDQFGEGQPASLRAAGELIGPRVASGDVKGLLRFVDSPNTGVSQFAISAMSVYLQDDSKDSTRAAMEIADLFKAGGDSKSRGSYLKLLIATGSDHALEVTQEAMQGRDAVLQSMAYKSVKEWPNDRILDLLVTQIDKTSDPQLSSMLFKSLSVLAGADREREDAEQEKAWKAVAGAASAEDEKLLVLRSVGSRKEEWAFYIVEFFKSDALNKVSQLAESTYEKMEIKLRNSKR